MTDSPTGAEDPAAPVKWSRTAVALGVLLLGTGLLINWRLSRIRGEDIGQIYAVGKSIVRGLDIYRASDLRAVYREFNGSDVFTPWGVFYPPSSGIAILPLTFLPLRVVKVVWFVLSCATLLAGVYQLIRLFAPRLQPSHRVLILGALMCTSATRWVFFYLQPAPLIFGLLCIYLAALHRGQTGLAFGIAAFVVCLKFTLALPFAGLALLRRGVVFAAAIAVVWITANAVGFARLGGMESLAGYQAQMTRFEQPNQLNYPDFRQPNSMQRLDWTYLLNAPSLDLRRSQVLARILSVLALAWLLREYLRARTFDGALQMSGAFLGPLICLSLLSVYHHHYDSIALFGPAIVYLGRPRQPRDDLLVLLYVVPVALFAGLYQVQTLQQLLQRLFGAGLYPGLKLIGGFAVNLAFFASLVLLNRSIERRRADKALTPPVQLARVG